MIFAGDAIAAVTIGTISKAGLATSGGATIFSLMYSFDYYNPDPNPSGKGEPVVNMIDPSWEPYLSN